MKTKKKTRAECIERGKEDSLWEWESMLKLLDFPPEKSWMLKKVEGKSNGVGTSSDTNLL